ncbi:hypothetical protein M8J76_010266 [Diaphorina citri]|nr:hypothetical protein M8J76_010266 [Diaphorina citri]
MLSLNLPGKGPKRGLQRPHGEKSDEQAPHVNVFAKIQSKTGPTARGGSNKTNSKISKLEQCKSHARDRYYKSRDRKKKKKKKNTNNNNNKKKKKKKNTTKVEKRKKIKKKREEEEEEEVGGTEDEEDQQQ